MEQTDAKPTQNKGFKPLAEGKAGFENNAAQSGKIFNDIAYSKGLSKEEQSSVLSFATKNFNSLLRIRDNELLNIANIANEKIKRGSYLSFEGEQFKSNEVRISRSAFENVLKHISVFGYKDVVNDFDIILKNAKFKKYEILDKSKSSKNYGKKVARGVTGYNYYLSEWKGYKIEINMEVMRDGYEQPYAILFKKKTP